MKKIFFVKFILFYFLLPATFAQALSLDEAQKMASENNPKLKQMQSDVAISDANKLKSISAHLPQISLSGRHLFSEKFQSEEIALGGPPVNFELIEPYSDISATISLMVFDGFSTWNNYKAAKSNFSAAELNFNRSKFQLYEEIKMKFYQALGAKDLVDVAEQNVQVLEKHIQDIKNQIKGGVATQLDELRIEVQLEDAQTEFLSAKDNLVLAEAKLAQVLGVEKLPTSVVGAMPVISIEVINKADFGSGQRDDQRAQELKEEGNLYLSQAAKGQWLPKLNLYAKQSWYNNSNAAVPDAKFKDAYWLGLNLTWNLYDGGATWASSEIAAEQLKKSTEELRSMNQAIPVDIDFWKRRLIHSAASFRAGSVSVKKAEESVRLARNAVRAGIRTNADLLDSERDLYTSKYKVVRAQLDAIESESNLELALGKKLNLFR